MNKAQKSKTKKGKKKTSSTKIQSSRRRKKYTTQQGNQTIVKPGQDIVASMIPDLKRELLSLVEEEKKEVIVDLTGVEMVDSLGLGVLIAAHNSLSKNGRKLTVTNVSEDIYNLFKLMRLDKHFEVRST